MTTRWPFTPEILASEHERSMLLAEDSDVGPTFEVYKPCPWRTRDGEDLFVHQMEPSHRLNLYRYLWRNAERQRTKIVIEGYQCMAFVNGDMALLSIESDVAHLEECPIGEIMWSLPIIRALLEAICADTERFPYWDYS